MKFFRKKLESLKHPIGYREWGSILIKGSDIFICPTSTINKAVQKFQYLHFGLLNLRKSTNYDSLLQ